ncbi:MAG: GatB/YqeY domain-containing protein [Candidatus Paceibacterota bacterium]
MLVEEIKKDLISAQKERDEVRLSTLRMLLAAIVNKEKDKRLYVAALNPALSSLELDAKERLTDEEVMEVISSEAKKRKDSIASFEKGARQDLADQEKKELDLLKKYLPEDLTEDEIRQIVKEAIAKTNAEGAGNLGIVMKEVSPKTKGRADGYLVSQIVKQELEKK